MSGKEDIHRFIEKFRFLIVDEKGLQRSSTWVILQSASEESLYTFVNNFGGKLKLSFHPHGKSIDGNDSQYGLVNEHRNLLKAKGVIVPPRIRWKRPYDKSKINLTAKILFPTSFMTGDVYQFINEKKPKVAIPIAPIGHAVEVCIFSHYLKPEFAEELLITKGFTPFYYITQKNGEIFQITFRHVHFDEKITLDYKNRFEYKFSDPGFDSLKNIHATLISDVVDFQAIRLVEVNGEFVKQLL